MVIKMKRVFIVLLAISFIFSLTACSGDNSEKTMNSLENPTVKNSESDSDTASDTETDTNDIAGYEEETSSIADYDSLESETQNAPADSEVPEIDSELPLSGVSICVDPGHGKFAQAYQEAIGPGSSATKPAFVSGTAGSYQTEAEFNLKVGLMLQSLLEEQGATVYMTRTDENAYLSNIGRAQLGNDNNCDIAVRIHADGSENSSIHGVSMLVPAHNEFITDEYILSQSVLAGECVLEAVLEKTGANDRGIVYRDDLTGFNWSTIPSILIECGFMSNAEDDAKLADPEYQMLIAEGICLGLIEYFNY